MPAKKKTSTPRKKTTATKKKVVAKKSTKKPKSKKAQTKKQLHPESLLKRGQLSPLVLGYSSMKLMNY